MRLFHDPYSEFSRDMLSEALEQHLATGQSMDAILRLRTAGISARVAYFRHLRGTLCLSLYHVLGSDKNAADTLFNALYGRGELVDEEGHRSAVKEIRYINRVLDSKPLKSKKSFYQQLKAAAESTA